MRHGSTCLSWQSARRTVDLCNLPKLNSLSCKGVTPTTAALSQSRPRAAPHQWTSWTGNSSNVESDVDPRRGQTQLSVRQNSDKDYSSVESTASTACNSQIEALASNNASVVQSDVSVCSTLSFYESQESLRSLPSRPKPALDSSYPIGAHHSVEENRLRGLAAPQKGSANPNFPLLQRPVAAIEVNVARSRCHPRRRPCSENQPSAMPKLRRDTDCTDAIVRLIVFFSTKLVHTIWSQASNTPKSSKDFNGAGVLPLQVFIQETLRRSKTSYSTLQVALFYLILLRPHIKPCQATQQQYTPGCRALQCGRRMFLTALILASKYLQDRNYSARAWSKISGLPVAEINENERYYLELIKYNLHMSKETFENWSKVVLTVCKASGQGPAGGKPDSPPSSPNGLSCSADFEQPGSSGWWLHHLVRLTPDVVKNTCATDEYLSGLFTGTPMSASSLHLDTPPSSPESLEEMLSETSSPLVHPSSGLGHVSAIQKLDLGQSPANIGTVPSRPLPPNLPTPQTTPRYDSAFTFSQRSSQSDLRCRASLQALVNVDRQACAQANLETCPPPKPRSCFNADSNPGHPLREYSEASNMSWLSSPESSLSDSSSSSVTRSRSSSISSVSSVWSVPSTAAKQSEAKPLPTVRSEAQQTRSLSQQSVQTNLGSYSFYHSASGVQAQVDETKRCMDHMSANFQPPVACSKLQRDDSDLDENQIAHLLASLSSQSDDQVSNRTTNPAVIRNSGVASATRVSIGPGTKHKRSRSSKEDGFLQDEIRHLLWNEQPSVYVEDDKKPTTNVETPDKEAQYPLQSWAHPKKPVCNAMQTKRIALQHSTSEQSPAPQLAADFLRQSVTVM